MPKSTILIVFLFFLFTTNSNAQLSLGGVLNYDTRTELGFGITSKYNVGSKLGIAPSFYFIEKSKITIANVTTKATINQLNFDLHYRISKGEKGYIYPIIGAQFLLIGVSVKGDGNDVSASDSEIYLNAGIGGQTNLSSKITGLFEAKYSSSFDSLTLTTGLRYNF